MSERDTITKAIVKALKGMEDDGPENLLFEVNHHLQKSSESLTAVELLEVLTTGDKNAGERTAFHLTLARWDAAVTPEWTTTDPSSKERRAEIDQLLGFDGAAAQEIDSAYPPFLSADDVISADPNWDPWYDADRRAAHDFYWRAYESVISAKMQPESVAALDAVTTNIVSRLADPVAEEPYQAKGLVVGHVQSGKTANFTGVVAKAIDSGYRLIIVLTGTVEMLRGQTQRRLDMELIGEENILGGHDRLDPDAVKDVDYIGNDDLDWKSGKFISHGIEFADHADIPAIRRLTGMSKDFARLKHGLAALDFRAGRELANPRKPMWDPENLYGTDVRIAVVKKNSTVLRKLVEDLGSVKARLDEIPTLIIDDEADQASVNTTNPNKTSKEIKERKAINGHITDLLGKLKRAQYIGYTATPFANVFVSPDDSEDIFPKDFIISLGAPPQYMGGKEFHDLIDLDDAEKNDPGVSNEKAFVRDLHADERDEGAARSELRAALDAFVLAGAIKLWRVQQDPDLEFRHHTMLIHESLKQIDHEALAGIVRAEWDRAAYSSAAAAERLEVLYEADFKPVSIARGSADQLPSTFAEVRDCVGEVLDLVLVKGDPVVIVNGAAEKDYEKLDFQTERVWRILIGGTKLSRGFTVEGLTISYFRRRALAADSLMQMGRWFGYRPGYQDLVRLFIARNAKPIRGKSVDLYEAFLSIVQDEEEFRAQLHEFAKLDDTGEPMVRPYEVPPLVFQQLPWLKPTAANKMYNAELDFMGEGARLKDFARQPDHDPAVNSRHFEAVKGWIPKLNGPETFEYYDIARAKQSTFSARVVTVSAEDMLEALCEFSWESADVFEPTRSMIEKAMLEGTLTEWTVMVPLLSRSITREVDGVEVPVSSRNRRTDRTGFSGSSFRQRDAIEHIAGAKSKRGGPRSEQLHTPTMGAMLLTFAADLGGNEKSDPKKLPARGVDPGDIATLFSLALPLKSAPRGRIGFRVRNQKKPGDAIIDAVP